MHGACGHKPAEEHSTQSLLPTGTKVNAKWTDGKIYSAKVLGQHVAPSYVVSTVSQLLVVVTVADLFGHY